MQYTSPHLGQSFLRCCVALTLGLLTVAAHAIQPGNQVPTFNLSTTNGKTISNEDIKDHIVVIEFWATWCGPCVKAAPHMKKLYNTYHPKGVRFIGFSRDAIRGTNEDAATRLVNNFVNQRKITWPQAIASKDVTGRFKVSGIPHVFIFGPDGKLIWRGHPMSMDQHLKRAVENNKEALDAYTKEQKQSGTSEARIQQSLQLITRGEKALEKNNTKAFIAILNRIPAEHLENKDVLAKAQALIKTEAAQAFEATEALTKRYPKGIANLKVIRDSIKNSEENKDT